MYCFASAGGEPLPMNFDVTIEFHFGRSFDGIFPTGGKPLLESSRRRNSEGTGTEQY